MASTFVGRTSEIARLDALGAGTVVTLWGPGGVGKTRLAGEFAERERRRGRVVAWADLAGARTAKETLAAIASALGVALAVGDPGASDEATATDEVDALGRAACAQRALLVADNLEQLDDASRALLVRIARAIVTAGPKGGATLLATSRELLGAGRDVEKEIALAPLDEDDGLALFGALAGAASVDAAPAVARTIVQRLDALPLAIELAAARVPLLGMPELLARLDRKLDVLGTAKSDRPARHATLRAAIAWSWELLDDGEREALMACASFEAPFDMALAEAVLGGSESNALDRLERLRARALVHSSSNASGRTALRLLESVRDFAREMSAGVDAEAWLQRHAAAVVARCEPIAESAACGKDTLAELEALRGDLVAVSRRKGPWAARAALALATLLAISGPPSAALECIDGAMNQAELRDDDLLMVARLLLAKGDALRSLGRLADARECLSLPLSMADDLGDMPTARLVGAETRRVLGSVLRGLGHVDEALAHKEAALATYRALGDRAREGICLGEIGAVYQSEGKLERARSCHAEAIAIHVATGSRRAEGVERSFLAVATHRRGEPAASLPLHEQALVIHREVGHRRLEGAEVLHLGFVHHELGVLDKARELLRTARSLLVAAGARGLEAIALVFAARLEVDAGDTTTALLLLAEAAQVAPPSWPRLAATRHLVEAHLAMATGAPERACESYEAALATSRVVEVGFEALTPAYLAVALARAGRPSPVASSSVASLIAEATERISKLENPHLRVALAILAATASGRDAPEVSPASSTASSEVRRALAMSGAVRALVIDGDGKRVVLPDGRAVDLSRRKNVRLVLVALARARRDAPGAIVSAEALLEAGWAGERMRAEAATKRLHTAIWTLRSLGFEGIVLTENEGYLLDPRTNLVLVDG